jgi:DNA-binding transcriptional ArsR family regulator
MDLPTPLSPELTELIASRFRLLSEPMRIQILDRLRQDERSVGELVNELGTSQQNISKHLTILQREGVLARRREGNRAIYRIADPSVLDLCEHVCGSVERRAAELSRLVGRPA